MDDKSNQALKVLRANRDQLKANESGWRTQAAALRREMEEMNLRADDCARGITELTEAIRLLESISEPIASNTVCDGSKLMVKAASVAFGCDETLGAEKRPWKYR